MAIKTTTQYIDCLEINGIFPDDYAAVSSKPYSNGTLTTRLKLEKMVDDTADLGGYLFTPQILQSKNTSVTSSEVSINIVSSTEGSFNLKRIKNIALPAADNINLNLPVGEWTDLCPALVFGFEVPQRGKVYNLTGDFGLNYSASGYIQLNYLYTAAPNFEEDTYYALNNDGAYVLLTSGTSGLDWANKWNTYYTIITENRSMNFDFSAAVTTDTLEKSIYNPLYADPYNKCATLPQANIPFKLQFSGSELRTYALQVFEGNTNNRVYPPALEPLNPQNPANPLYNGDQLTFTIPSANFSPSLVSNNNYYWNLLMSRYSNSDENNLVDNTRFLFYIEDNLKDTPVYTNLEYITRAISGRSIAVPYTPTKYTKIRIKFKLTNSNSGILYNQIANSQSAYGVRFIQNGKYSITIGAQSNTLTTSSTYPSGKIYDLSLSNNYLYDNNSQSYILNSTKIDSFPSDFTTVFDNLYVAKNFTGDLYAIDFYEGSQLTASYTPKQRISDDKVGLFNLLTGDFVDFSTDGTGAGFTVGRIADMEFEKRGMKYFTTYFPLTRGFSIFGESNPPCTDLLDGLTYHINNPTSEFNFYSSIRFYLYPEITHVADETLKIFSTLYSYVLAEGFAPSTAEFRILASYNSVENSVVFTLEGMSGTTTEIGSIPLQNLVAPTSPDFLVDKPYVTLEFYNTIQTSGSGYSLQCESTITYEDYQNTEVTASPSFFGMPQFLNSGYGDYATSFVTSESYWYWNLYDISINRAPSSTLNVAQNYVVPVRDIETGELSLYDEITQRLFPSSSVFVEEDPGFVKQVPQYLQYPKFETPDYGFYTYSMPELTYYVNNVQVTLNSITVSSATLNFTANYSQNEGIEIKYYNVYLYDSNGNLIDSKEHEFSNNITYGFEGLLTSSNYVLEFSLINQAGQTVSKTINIAVNYTVAQAVVELFNAEVLTEIGGVLCTWVTESAGRNFKIYRRAKTQNYYEEVATPIFVSEKLNFCIDVEAKNNTTYYYAIASYNGTVLSELSSEKAVVTDFQSFYLYSLNSKNSFYYPAPFFTTQYEDGYYTFKVKNNIFSVTTGEGASALNLSTGDLIILGETGAAEAKKTTLRIVKYLGEVSNVTQYLVETIDGETPATAALGDFYYKIFIIKINKYQNCWRFYLNCEENTITLNQDKTLFASFAKYPKYSVGKNNYRSGSLTALLGSEYYDNQYFDTEEIVSNWRTFIEGQNVFLYKNLKGDIMIVMTDTGSTFEYMNQVANYYKENGRISAHPTTISFTYNEVDDIKKLKGIIGSGEN